MANITRIGCLALVAGCYSPDPRDCAFTCNASSEHPCPSGLTCLAGVCRVDPNPTTTCGDAAPICDWTLFPPSNFDPPSLPALGPAWSVTIDTMYDTAGTGTGGPVGIVHPLTGGYEALLVYIASFSVSPGKRLTVTGPRPLLIVADTTIQIDGIIDVLAGGDGPGCAAATAGTSAGAGGGGGGGGGYAADGGNGGLGATGLQGMAGSMTGNTELVPLRGGCSGAAGARSTTLGLAGIGGGGVQLAARQRVSIMGNIVGNGRGGGRGGDGTTTGAAGGGGGGTGGAIFIEACEVVVGGNASLCANAGAGGGGGRDLGSVTRAATAGGDGSCTSVAAGGIGAHNQANDNHGGDGGFGGAPSGLSAPNVTDAYDLGGGGGGSVGRIRIRAAAPPMINMTATILPQARID